jgi:hypothetical protein
VTIRAVLDTSAIRAYSAGDIAVGELIGEFSNEGVQFAIPTLCMVEAATGPGYGGRVDRYAGFCASRAGGGGHPSRPAVADRL